ncbi:MAG: hypothetical protein GTO45_04760 [Candidatus Aminicenantes bacterium]|nr:hypothetical protein [Candidatus Aminicenantes bacterium]NIM78064.1 hypothetical protein [Candidatus Aminicenantes bacterium]NIN17381.1 hypothetical protein [Candidatus Aminicenantes bacterium]NIN41274.1 hypothetical protein [Candidatus Aminicenantes bacterium]NIN84047.1 hypothetical protein [Candidatus Aminicenantes bacterium]
MERRRKIDLFSLADANSDYLKKEYKRVKSNSTQNKSGLLDNFRKKIQEEWNLSINMKDWALMDFLVSGEYKNIYTLKEDQADQLVDMGELKISEKKDSLEEALRKHLKKYYESRIVFDTSIVDGEKIKYAALNIGGTGINCYARYCVIIRKEDAEGYNSLAFIKNDSAIHYVGNQSILVDRLVHDVSNKECVSLLAALKHESEIEELSADRWAAVICCDTSYIEGVTGDDILNTHIRSVRIDKNYYNGIFKDLLLKLFYSELSEEEQYRLALLKRLFAELEKRSIELEIIDEN